MTNYTSSRSMVNDVRCGAVLALTVAILLLAGCDLVGGQEDTTKSEYVVQSYQVAGEPLQTVRVSRTAPVDSTYDFAALAIADAEVRIELLDEAGEVEAQYPFRARDWQPGVYEPEPGVGRAIVQPLHTYRLHVQVPEGDIVTATTVVPDTFRLLAATGDRVTYQSSDQLELQISRSRYPGRQNIFLFTAAAQGELTYDRLTPSRRQFIDEDDDLESLRTGTSPPLSEANYDVVEGNVITIRVPWFTVSFLGPNRLRASAVDDNIYDFIRSEAVQEGGSTLAPGEIPNVLDHVEGGTGLFGSYAETHHDVFIDPPAFDGDTSGDE